MFPPYPQIPYFDIYGQMEAAQQVGGDFFDFFLIEDDRVGFVIGDVSGKGVPSSIFMAVARTLIHSYGIAKFSTSECLRLTNEVLCTESVDSMFVTVFYGILNYKTGELKYTNAGHNYPYILKNDGNFIILETGSSIILGAFGDAKFTENTITLEPNDSIVLYTDGVNESMNSEHKQLGTDVLEHHLQLLVKRNVPKLITEGIFNLVKQHAQDCPQSDDITVLTISYLGDN
jgi:sigma-B regulation protein RsbU (phosphoserine phosphatase)